MAVKPIPAGFHAVTPYVVVKGADEFIEFMKKAFGAVENHRTTRPDGAIMHAEIRIEDSIIEVSEATKERGPRPAALHLYVGDADAAYRRAIAAGATSIREPADQFYGDREGDVQDPFGNFWFIATHIEDVPPEELRRRMQGAKAKT